MAADQAAWCLATRQSPKTWRQLTRRERDAFYEELERRHG